MTLKKSVRKNCDLTLFDSYLGDFKVLSSENGPINAITDFNNEILYTGASTKNSEDGFTLTSLDSLHWYCEILFWENSKIRTASIFNGKILYVDYFTKSDK